MNTNRGSSLIELILYTGLISIILVALYQFYTIAAYQKIGEVVDDELYYNANSFIDDITQTVTQAENVTEPAVTLQGSRLSLNNGLVVYELDGNNRLVKTENGVSDFITNANVRFSLLLFEHRGPSAESSTIDLSFTLEGVHEVEGRIISRDFQTAVSVR